MQFGVSHNAKQVEQSDRFEIWVAPLTDVPCPPQGWVGKMMDYPS
jgi:hypothetical protein